MSNVCSPTITEENDKVNLSPWLLARVTLIGFAASPVLFCSYMVHSVVAKAKWKRIPKGLEVGL